MEKNKGITLIALVITIIILLILAGVAISSLGGENGLFANVKRAKQAQIKSEMREQLVLALQELQLEKKGDATLDDVTQEWADSILEDYEAIVSSDASISGKKVTMSKGGVIGRYIIDEKLNIVETEETSTGAQLTYEVKSRDGENLQVVVTVTDNENGLKTIEYNDGHIQEANGLKTVSRDCTIQLGVEYKVKIISKSGEEKTETILINEYYHTITKNLGEGIEIDNTAIKAEYNKSYTATLTTGEEYILETFTVTMGGETVEVDPLTGVINIEKVTGDIEIIATAKKLEIVTTEAFVNTSPNATSSAEANSVDKTLYTLYVTFTATLLGEDCTIEPPLSDGVQRNGKYTYTITGTYQGKTITTTKDVVVNQYKSSPNLVAYDAGEWTAEEIKDLNESKLYAINIDKTVNKIFKLENNESGLNFTFGGFTYKGNETYSDEINSGKIITSRNQSVTPESQFGIPLYDGWRLFDMGTKTDSEGNTIKNSDGTDRIYVNSIIHAGSPENFVFYKLSTSSKENCRAEYLLSDGARQSGYSTLSTGTTINPRNWDMYKDKELDKKGYIQDVHIMTYKEAYDITNSENATNGVRNTGSRYYLATAYESGYQYLHYVSSGGSMKLSSGTSNCCGIRPIVTMKDGVYIASGSGVEGDPYVLAKEPTE